MIGVYVAGSSADRDRVRAFMQRVRDAGMVITFDWIEAMERAGVGDEGLCNPDRRRYATADLTGVENARVVVVLLDDNAPTRGAWVELGYAIGLRESEGPDRHAIIVCGGRRRSIFTVPGLVDSECENDDQAFARLVQIAESDNDHSRR